MGLALSGYPAQQEDEPIVALVNGRAITKAKFELHWEKLADATRTCHEKTGGKRQFLDELITRELPMQEARRQGTGSDRYDSQ